MKLRRAMAVAAATAVITPAAFLMAPAAFATEGSPSPSASESTTETSPSPSQSETTAPSPSTSESQTTAPSPSQSETTAPSPSTSVTTSPSNTVVPSPSASEPAEVCEDFKDNEGVYTELRGLPSKVVAGSGWKNFTFRVTNKTNKTFDSVEAYIMAEAVDGKDFEDISQFITLQVQLEEDGPWQSIDDVEGYFGTTGSLQPKKFAEAQMRLKVDAKAPAGYGAAFTLGVHISKDSVCEYGEMNTYEFEILAAGSKPGDVDDSKGKPGKPSGNKPAPTGQLSQLPVTGSLANTGSNSMLPTIGIAGGIAIVAGAGVVFALKRRSNGAAA